MFLRWFKNKWNNNNLCGLDIGPSALKLLKINSAELPFKVENFAILPLPTGAVVKDEIKEMNVVGEILKDLMRISDLKTKNVAISIPKSSTIVKTITIDKRLNSDEIESRAWIEAHRHFPDLVGDIYLDFAVLGPSAEDPNLLDLILIACRKDQLKPYLELAKMAGLTIKVVDVNQYAFMRSLESLTSKMQDLKTIAALNLDSHLSTLIAVQDNNLIYAHDQSFDSARLINQVNKFNEESNKSLENKELNEINYLTILKEAMGAHLRHTMHFFFSSRPNVSIQKIFLSGDCATIPHLDTFIRQELGIDTVVADPFVNMEFTDTVDKLKLRAHAPSLMLCCGLALTTLK